MLHPDSVERWINNNTYDCGSYLDVQQLLKAKQEKNLSICIVIPVLEEEKTIGNILSVIINKLVKDVPLIDNITVIDGGSMDNTISICEKFKPDIALVDQKNILDHIETSRGKGNQLWKALYKNKSDIIVYMDSDLKNFHEQYVLGLLGPLLLESNITFVKGFYDRKLCSKNGKSSSGGRVTELCARPLINLLYPELAGFIQPLSGEYAGYTSVFKSIHFTTGYSVEMKILLEILDNYGIQCMGQVNLYTKEHDHQPLNALTKMSFAIMKTMLEHKNVFTSAMNESLLIKNMSIDHSDQNLKIRSNTQEHCNHNGNEMNNEYFKTTTVNDKLLVPMNEIETKDTIQISNEYV